MDTLTRSKTMAKALRKALAEQQIELSHSTCLEIVARQHGFSDWNVMKAACDDELLLTLTIFVEHGRQQEAALFYETAFGAVRTKTYLLPTAVQTKTSHIREGEVMALDLRLSDRVISVCGSNPRREAEPARGGPFFLKEKGAGSTIFRLEVNDANTILKRAVTAGAAIHDALQVLDDGRRSASFFDPFGHIWALYERVAVAKREVA